MARPDTATIEILKKGVEQSFSWLNWLGLTALVFALVTSIARHTNGADIFFLGVELPYQLAPFVFLIFTVINLFILKHLTSECWDAWQHLPKRDRHELYNKVVRNGGVVTKGAFYYKDSMYEFRGRLFLKTEAGSPETWIHHSLFVLSFAAMIGFRWDVIAFIQFSIAYILIRLNWDLAANALMLLADLGRSDENSLFFVGGKKGIRPFSTVSGFMVSGNQKPKHFVIATIMDTFFGILSLAALLGVLVLFIALARWIF